MGVYDIDGLRGNAYMLNGQTASAGYDLNGNIVYPDASTTITVMSFNTGCFYSMYYPCPAEKGNTFYERHRTIFNRYTPIDIAGFSEWYNAIGDIPASTLMNEFFDDYYPEYIYPVQGAALTSAFSVPIKSKTLVKYSSQRPGTGERYYQKIVATFGGRDISCFLTHLDTSSYRNAQFQELLDVLANEQYFIALGDFNFQVVNVGDSEYNASLKKVLDAGYHSAQNNIALYTTWYNGQTVATSSEQHALDNIFTSANIDITQVTVDILKLTDGLCQENEIIIDHLPIIATLVIR